MNFFLFYFRERRRAFVTSLIMGMVVASVIISLTSFVYPSVPPWLIIAEAVGVIAVSVLVSVFFEWRDERRFHRAMEKARVQMRLIDPVIVVYEKDTQPDK